MDGKILVIIADGFEEIETITPIDILKRLDFKVIIAGVDKKNVTGAHGIKIEADCTVDQVNHIYYSTVIIPGGLPNATSLRDNEEVKELIRLIYKKGGIAAAICASPIVLNKAGVLAGKKVTSYPDFEGVFTNSVFTGADVEVDGRIITAKGAGLSVDFSAAIAKTLGVDPTEVLNQMFFIL